MVAGDRPGRVAAPRAADDTPGAGPRSYFPVHLGTGKKLFRDGAKAAALRLVSASTTSTGVVIATYQPAGPVQTGSYALDQ